MASQREREIKADITELVNSDVANKRALVNKHTGIVRVNYGKVELEHTISSKVSWNQSGLEEAFGEIHEAGFDPKDFVEVSYKVSSTSMNNAPESVRSILSKSKIEDSPTIKINLQKKEEK